MQQKPGMKGLKAAIEGLAGVVAVIAAFLGTPEVHGRTVVWIGHLIQRQYGAEFVEIAGFVWFVLVWLLLYFIARIGTEIVIVMGGLYLALRFL